MRALLTRRLHIAQIVRSETRKEQCLQPIQRKVKFTVTSDSHSRGCPFM